MNEKDEIVINSDESTYQNSIDEINRLINIFVNSNEDINVKDYILNTFRYKLEIDINEENKYNEYLIKYLTINKIKTKLDIFKNKVIDYVVKNEIWHDKIHKLYVNNGTLYFKFNDECFEEMYFKKYHLYDKDKVFTEMTNASYEPGSNPPNKFIDFVKNLFNDNIEVIDFFWRFLVTCLIGENTYHKFITLFGSGANGKTTLIKVLEEVFGTYVGKLDPILLKNGSLSNEKAINVLFALRNKRIIVVDEPNSKQKIDLSLFKRITGDDSFSVISSRLRKENNNSLNFRIEGKIIVDTNHLFKIDDIGDEGFWRRIEVLPLRKSVISNNQNKNLFYELFKEKNEILTYLVGKYISDFNEKKLENKDKSLNIVKDLYSILNNSIEYFINSKIEINDKIENQKIQSAVLYSEYVKFVYGKFAEFENYFNLNKNYFKNNGYLEISSMKKLNVEIVNSDGINYLSNGKYFWKNVKIKNFEIINNNTNQDKESIFYDLVDSINNVNIEFRNQTSKDIQFITDFEILYRATFYLINTELDTITISDSDLSIKKQMIIYNKYINKMFAYDRDYTLSLMLIYIVVFESKLNARLKRIIVYYIFNACKNDNNIYMSFFDKYFQITFEQDIYKLISNSNIVSNFDKIEPSEKYGNVDSILNIAKNISFFYYNSKIENFHNSFIAEH